VQLDSALEGLLAEAVEMVLPDQQPDRAGFRAASVEALGGVNIRSGTLHLSF
jgi:hypothetical protein